MTQPDNSIVADPWQQRLEAFPFGLTGAVVWILAIVMVPVGLRELVDPEAWAAEHGLPDFTAQLCVMFLIIVGLGVWLRVRRPASLVTLGVKPTDLRGDLKFTFVALLLLGLFYAGAIGVLWLATRFLADPDPSFLELIRQPGFSDLSIRYLVGVVLLYPLFEEVIYRGVLYPPLRKEFGAKLAILFSAVIFAAAHGGYPVNQFFGGLVFAYAYEKRRSLLPPLLLHIAGNGSLAVFGWVVSKG